jgi:predicted glutamine amidotransferase
MCELFGISSRVETSVSLSMELLARRGGHMDHLGDGGGMGLYDANDARLFREPEAAGESAWVRFIGT